MAKGNIETLATTREQYEEIINCIRNGYEYKQKHRPNNMIASAIQMEANLGIRVSDIVKLRLCDIVYDGNRYRLDITEQKTGKKRTFTVKPNIYNYLVNYAYENNLSKTDRLFPVTTTAIQKQIRQVCEYLDYERISTHSFRKMYATSIYEQKHDIVTVQTLLQHSSCKTTQRYINVSQETIDEAINNYDALI